MKFKKIKSPIILNPLKNSVSFFSVLFQHLSTTIQMIVHIAFKYYLKYVSYYYIVFQITILIAKHVIELRRPNFLNHSLIIRYGSFLFILQLQIILQFNSPMDLAFSPLYYFLRINFQMLDYWPKLHEYFHSCLTFHQGCTNLYHLLYYMYAFYLQVLPNLLLHYYFNPSFAYRNFIFLCN